MAQSSIMWRERGYRIFSWHSGAHGRCALSTCVSKKRLASNSYRRRKSESKDDKRIAIDGSMGREWIAQDSIIMISWLRVLKPSCDLK